MFAWKQNSQLVSKFGRPAVILPMLLAVALVGCTRTDPVKALRKQGAVIKYQDKRKRDKVESVRLPEKAGDSAVLVLKEEVFADVKELDLSNTDITDEALASLKPLTNLQKLDLRNTNITDAGLEHLKALPSLTTLDLGDTLVTDAGLKHLQDIKQLENLNLTGAEKPKEPKKRSWKTAIRLGIDLAGGTNLVYQVMPTDEKKVTSESMNQMVAAVKRRLDPAGTEEITVRVVGSDRIEVIIPRADPEVVVAKKKQMTRLGALEFAMLANRNDHAELIAKAQSAGPAQRDFREDGVLVAGWREVALKPDGTQKTIGPEHGVVFRDSPRDKNVTEYLVVFGKPERRILGKYLSRAFEDNDQNLRPAVGFSFNARGANLFYTLTSNNLPISESGFHRRLAILLDERIHSAPSINSAISDRGIIQGDFTQEEVQELVTVLNAGALALPFRNDPITGQPAPISEQSISPTLGADVQQKGQTAILAAAITVFVFMLVYYLFAGFVADVCLLLNLVLVMGSMAFIDAAFTLPGMAGIVLTIGMAVDANVLIFERMREEMNRGSSLRMSIQNGFGKAFTTIVDANITTLITAVVLYMIGTDQVRGFAVTLFIGIVMSMFSALFFGRLIFDICERKRLIKGLKMNSLVGATNWNFISKKKICGTVSIALILAGIAGIVMRGGNMLDIDFRGGTMVTFEFQKPQEIEDVKKVLSKSDVLSDGLAVERLTSADDDEAVGKKYRVRGTERDVTVFKNAIIEAFQKTDSAKYALRQVRIAQFESNMLHPIEPASAKKNPNRPEPPGPQISSEFFGGQWIEFTFQDDGMKVNTFRDYVANAIGRIGASEEGAQGKYTRPGDLLEVAGLKATGNAEEAKFETVRLIVKKEVDKADLITALTAVKKELDTTPIFPEVNNFDAAVAGDMQQSAILAMLFSLAAIVGYIWFRFQHATFGIAAVAALVHDVLIVLGVVALAGFLSDTGLAPWLDFKINLPMIAAFLTIVGYSLNDTIVVFDRIREVRGKNPAMTDTMVNTSLNQTLSRTLLTSFTTFIVVAILYIWGGEGIRGFAFCLTLGVIVGTYSSIYVASPILIWLMNSPGSATSRATAAVQSPTT